MRGSGVNCPLAYETLMSALVKTSRTMLADESKFPVGERSVNPDGIGVPDQKLKKCETPASVNALSNCVAYAVASRSPAG